MSVADVREYCSKNMLPAKYTIETVLDKLTDVELDMMYILPEGALEGADDGIVFSSLRMLLTIKRATEAYPDGVPASCDGKYKVHVGNWVLVIFCTHTLRWRSRF